MLNMASEIKNFQPSIYFHSDSIRVMEECGFNDLRTGSNKLTWDTAGNLVLRMSAHLRNGNVPKGLQKRFESYYKQICFSFGPEFEKEFLL